MSATRHVQRDDMRTDMAHKHSTTFVRALLIAMAASAVPLLAQGPPGPTIGTDLSGEWAPRFHEDQPERIPGPDIGDYLGLPINEAARLHGDSWDASLLTLPTWVSSRECTSSR